MSTVNTFTRVAKDTGAVIKPGPMVVAAEDQIVTESMFNDVAQDSGFNGPFLADLLAAMSTHENMGVGLFRTLQNLTVNPALKSTYKSFEKDAVAAVEAYQELMSTLGIPNNYVSPAGRMTEGLDSHMIMSFLGCGSADQLTVDTKTVEATLLASTMCVANTALLSAIGSEAKGETQQAIAAAISKLEAPQQEHLDWARQTQQSMALTMVKHRLGQKLTEFGETVISNMKRAVS
jgi:hypothetical protein